MPGAHSASSSLLPEKGASVSSSTYTYTEQQIKPHETLQVRVYEDGPRTARQRPFHFPREKQVKFIPSLPHHASLLISTSCDGTEDRITSGFDKAGLQCKIRFSAGGTFSRLAFWSVKGERLSLYTLLGTVNNTTEYHYVVNKVKLQMTKLKYKKKNRTKETPCMMNNADNIMINWHRSHAQSKDHTNVSFNREITQGVGSNLPNQESALSFGVAKPMEMFGISKS